MREKAGVEVRWNTNKLSCIISNVIEGELCTGCCAVVLKTVIEEQDTIAGAMKLVW
jgi:hypothetical protein